MAAKRPASKRPAGKASKPMGRPPKAGTAGTAEHVVGLRLSTPDKALLDALVAQERARLRETGMMEETAARVGPADVLRSLIREAAAKRGVTGSSPAGS